MVEEATCICGTGSTIRRERELNIQILFKWIDTPTQQGRMLPGSTSLCAGTDPPIVVRELRADNGCVANSATMHDEGATPRVDCGAMSEQTVARERYVLHKFKT